MGVATNTRLERRLSVLQWVILGTFVFVLAVPFIYTQILLSTGNAVQTLKIENIEVLSSPVLCPGDKLQIRFDFLGRGTGIVLEDATWVRVTPPQTIISSQVERFILPADFSRKVYRTWEVPYTYRSEKTGLMTDIEPGKYKRYFSLTTPSRSIIIDNDEVIITIPSHCTQEKDRGKYLVPISIP